MRRWVIWASLFILVLLSITILPVGATDPPNASFTSPSTSGTLPFTVSFTDTSSNSPTGWAWFFGDENWTAPWTNVTASAGSGWARMLFSSVVMPDGSIVLMGGLTDGAAFKNDVWRSTDNGGNWTLQTGAAGWSARCRQSAVVMPDGSIVLMGGNVVGSFANDVWRSTDSGATWTLQTGAAGWSARAYPISVVMPDGSIVLMGGYSMGPIYHNDVWRSMDNGVTWTQVITSGPIWSGRDLFSSVVMPDGSILLMGGEGSGSNYKNDTWRSTDYGATWTNITGSPGWSARYAHSSVVMPDSSIVLMGGGNTGFLNDVWRSTDNGTTWTNITGSSGWSARSAHSSVAMPDGSIVLMGGGNTNYLSDVWRFVPTGSSVKNPSHTYTATGIYNVTLQAFNSVGYNSTRMLSYITVLPMVAAFSGTPTSGTAPLAVQFTDASTSTPTGWAWFFGDENYTQAWTQQTPGAGWSGRDGISSVAMPDGSIVLMGGFATGGGTSYSNDVWRSTDNGTAWTRQTAGAGWSARWLHSSVAMPDGSIVLMGGTIGSGNTHYNDVWRFVPTGSSLQNPSHTYTSAGVFQVALQAFNTGGYNSTRKTGYIVFNITNLNYHPRTFHTNFSQTIIEIPI